MKRKFKIGDRIRCGSYTDMSFKTQELKNKGFIYRTWTEYDLGMKRKLYIEIVGKAKGGKRGYETKTAAEATIDIDKVAEALTKKIKQAAGENHENV
jgi:hypothetical protein